MKANYSLFVITSIIVIILISSCNSSVEDKNELVKKKVEKAVVLKSSPKIDSLFIKKFELNTEDNNRDSIQLFKIDNEKSLVTWFCVTHTGYVKFKNGYLKMLDNKIVSGEFEVLMDSIRDTDIDYYLMRVVLENTLKSDSFFNVNAHPLSILKLTHLKKLESNKYYFGGDLQINGINNRISFRAQIIQNDTSILVLTDRFYIDRTKWGVTIYSRNFEQTDDSFLFTDSVSVKVTAVLNNISKKTPQN